MDKRVYAIFFLLVSIAFIGIILTSSANAPVQEKTITGNSVADVIKTSTFNSSEIVKELNSEQKYLDFIKDSKYHSVKINEGDRVYSFVYEDGIVKEKIIDEYDLVINLGKGELEKIFKNNDIKGLLSKIPFKVKVNVASQCMGTDWCRKEIL